MWAIVVVLAFAVSVVSATSLTHLTSYEQVRGTPYNVTFDSRSVRINNVPILLQAGSIHYPRSTPDMWPNLMNLTKSAGLNTVQIYFFWDFHEARRGEYDFSSGSHNLAAFFQAVGDAGLFAFLRIGPYVCAEWSYGGMPVWLREDDIVFRSMDPKWLAAMSTIMYKVSTVIEPYLARNGGPIILAQIENEYGNVESSYPDGPAYVQWCGQLSQNLSISVPWVMCQQQDAPDYIINSCNGFYCDNWIGGHQSSHPKQPPMWTELWSGWFYVWSEAKPSRPAQDVAFAVARWVQRGGAYYNYYMWHGGTTFGRHVGGPFITTSYDYDAPIDEYGVPHPVKYQHLSNLHHLLNAYSAAIITNPIPSPLTPCSTCEIHVYGALNTSGTIVFAANWDDAKDYTVGFAGKSWTLPAWTVSVIDGQSLKLMWRTDQLPTNDHHDEMTLMSTDGQSITRASSISWLMDRVGNSSSDVIVRTGPAEQITTTYDRSDYLWYVTPVILTQDQINRGYVVLSLSNAGDFELIFFNGVYQTVTGNINSKESFNIVTKGLTAGVSYPLQILSGTMGLENYGANLERDTRGLTGVVQLDTTDLTKQQFTHSIGLRGEIERWFTVAGSQRVQWAMSTKLYQPLIWYNITVITPNITPPSPPALVPTFQLDVSGLGKGSIYFNEFHLGRYWNLTAPKDGCAACEWRGQYDPSNCRYDCGKLSQQFLHVPLFAIKSPGQANYISIFEERGGDPTTLMLIQRN